MACSVYRGRTAGQVRSPEKAGDRIFALKVANRADIVKRQKEAGVLNELAVLQSCTSQVHSLHCPTFLPMCQSPYLLVRRQHYGRGCGAHIAGTKVAARGQFVMALHVASESTAFVYMVIDYCAVSPAQLPGLVQGAASNRCSLSSAGGPYMAV